MFSKYLLDHEVIHVLQGHHDLPPGRGVGAGLSGSVYSLEPLTLGELDRDLVVKLRPQIGGGDEVEQRYVVSLIFEEKKTSEKYFAKNKISFLRCYLL